MKIESLLSVLALSVAAGCQSSSGGTAVQEQGGPGADPMPDMASMMAYATPGEAHAELAKGEGKWNVAGKIFMAPGAPPMEMEATAEVSMILDGRFLVEEFHGSMMGMPFEGQLLLGYNNITKEYQSVWIDNFGTGLTWAAGPESEGGSVHLAGEIVDPRSPGGRPFRQVSTHEGGDRATMQMYDTLPDGSEFLVMELVYTRP